MIFEPLVEVIVCDRHVGVLDRVRYMIPGVVEACGNCQVIA